MEKDKLVESIFKSIMKECKKEKNKELMNKHIVIPIFQEIKELIYPYSLTIIIIFTLIIILLIVILVLFFIRS